MSWLTGLAGRAEDILNKLDQNAATVLSQQLEQENGNNENESSPSTLIDIKNLENGGGNKLLINPVSRTASPLKLRSIKSENSIKSDPQPNGSSSRSSRRSSFSSKHDGTAPTVIEKQITANNVTSNCSIENVTSSSGMQLSLEQELAALKIVLAEIKSERDELKSENDNLMDQIKSTSSQTRIKELEDFCLEIEGERNELLEKVNVLESSTGKYIKSISELETVISKMQQHEIEMMQKLEWAVQEKDQCASELVQYRTRAQSSLQAKEKMIEELKAGGTGSNGGGQRIEEIEQENRILELDGLRGENANLSQQVETLKTQIEQVKERFSDIEEKNRERMVENDEKCEKMLEKLKHEQNRNRELEIEVKAKAQELGSVRDEIVRLRSNMSKKMYEKEMEINKIRDRFSHQSENMSASGIEERLQSLTQSLVQKQTSLESLTAERNALRLQLEKIENQHRTTMLQLRQQRPQILNMNDTDDAKAQVPNFLQENPFDTGVARRVKRAYSSLDSVSVRIGVLLRRFPLVRIFVIIYMGLLHLWVLVVLLSTTPS